MKRMILIGMIPRLTINGLLNATLAVTTVRRTLLIRHRLLVRLSVTIITSAREGRNVHLRTLYILIGLLCLLLIPNSIFLNRRLTRDLLTNGEILNDRLRMLPRKGHLDHVTLTMNRTLAPCIRAMLNVLMVTTIVVLVMRGIMWVHWMLAHHSELTLCNTYLIKNAARGRLKNETTNRRYRYRHRRRRNTRRSFNRLRNCIPPWGTLVSCRCAAFSNIYPSFFAGEQVFTPSQLVAILSPPRGSPSYTPGYHKCTQ